jgi:hypothetical protein
LRGPYRAVARSPAEKPPYGTLLYEIKNVI